MINQSFSLGGTWRLAPGPSNPILEQILWEELWDLPDVQEGSQQYIEDWES
jgi:hypothetical protein